MIATLVLAVIALAALTLTVMAWPGISRRRRWDRLWKEWARFDLPAAMARGLAGIGTAAAATAPAFARFGQLIGEMNIEVARLTEGTSFLAGELGVWQLPKPNPTKRPVTTARELFDRIEAIRSRAARRQTRGQNFPERRIDLGENILGILRGSEPTSLTDIFDRPTLMGIPINTAWFVPRHSMLQTASGITIHPLTMITLTSQNHLEELERTIAELHRQANTAFAEAHYHLAIDMEEIYQQ